MQTACGGGAKTPEGPTTKAEFVGQANRICTDTAEVIADQFIHTLALHPPETDQLLTLFRNLSPLLHQLAEDIDAIPPPAGDEQQVAAIVEAGTEEADRLDQAIADPRVLRAALADRIFPRSYQAFLAYGVRGCARITNPRQAPNPTALPRVRGG